MEQNPIDIIRSFAEDHLECNLDNLITFDLKKLMKDEVYGCPNRKFDADDTTIMRAIYCVVFGSVWPNLSMDNSGNEKMRGDTMNSSATFFSYPWNDRFTPTWNPPAFLIKKIAEFQTTFHTVGNMTVLPDKRIDECSINKHRGCHDEWHDYEDRFLYALYKVLTYQDDADEDLEELVMLNRDDLIPSSVLTDGNVSLMGICLNIMLTTTICPLLNRKVIRGGEVDILIKSVSFKKPTGILMIQRQSLNPVVNV